MDQAHVDDDTPFEDIVDEEGVPDFNFGGDFGEDDDFSLVE